jgi:ubiquinone/menaquinone biosynthesis C-methylase UbiE
MLLRDVLRDEAEFANREYAAHASDLAINETMFCKYAAPSQLWDWRQLAALLLGDLTGKQFLDLGCGMGEEAVYFAKLGARVTAIDVSDVGIAILRRRAAYNGLDIRSIQGRCDQTLLPAESFDRVHGLGILHHTGIDSGLAEVHRLLRPGGSGVFLEPLGDQPLVEAAKRFLMSHDEVTEHEHNLTWRELDQATARFSRVATYPYHLLYRIKRFMPASLHDRLRRIDHALLSIAPKLRRVAGAVVIHVVR